MYPIIFHVLEEGICCPLSHAQSITTAGVVPVQGYLAQKKLPPPQDHHGPLGVSYERGTPVADIKLQKVTDAQPAHLYRDTSLIRNRNPVGPCSRTMPRGLW